MTTISRTIIGMVLSVFLLSLFFPATGLAYELRLKAYCGMLFQDGTGAAELNKVVKRMKVKKKLKSDFDSDKRKFEILLKSAGHHHGGCGGKIGFTGFEGKEELIKIRGSDFNSASTKKKRTSILGGIRKNAGDIDSYIEGLKRTKIQANKIIKQARALQADWKKKLRKRDAKNLKKVLDKIETVAKNAKKIIKRTTKDYQTLGRQTNTMIELFEDEIENMQ